MTTRCIMPKSRDTIGDAAVPAGDFEDWVQIERGQIAAQVPLRRILRMDGRIYGLERRHPGIRRSHASRFKQLKRGSRHDLQNEKAGRLGPASKNPNWLRGLD